MSFGKLLIQTEQTLRIPSCATIVNISISCATQAFLEKFAAAHRLFVALGASFKPFTQA